MAGGVGTRFWPSSTSSKPKQFLDILGTGKSLLRSTYERFLNLTPKENIYVVTNRDYINLVSYDIPEISEEQILAEPSRNNTAPCIAYTSFKLMALNSNANLVIVPSDHLILNENLFIETIKEGLNFTKKNDALVTLGIQPTRPDTGYGYIQFEKSQYPHKVLKFTEKPPLDIAQSMVESGNYLWNAGIFICKAFDMVKAFKLYSTEIYDLLNHSEIYNSPHEKRFLEEKYPLTPNISVDYAIMEKASNVFTIPGTFGWSDLGTWASLHSEMKKTKEGNGMSHSQIFLENVHNSLIKLPNAITGVIKGLENFLVILDNDTLLIWPKDQEQEIKSLVNSLKEKIPPHKI